MALSVLDLFSIGIGPSSSHTVGPMRAGKRFADGLQREGLLPRVTRVKSQLFGSLGATGIGHGSNKAVIWGLMGLDPDTIDTSRADDIVQEARDSGKLIIDGVHPVEFEYSKDVIMHLRKSLPAHPNGMTFTAYDKDDNVVAERTYYSVGGGFVVDDAAVDADKLVTDETPIPYPFTTGAELLEQCEKSGLSIAQLMLANELSFQSEHELRVSLLHIWDVMKQCVENGCTRTEETLPGGLAVRRRAPGLRKKLEQQEASQTADNRDPLFAMEWVNLYALAVNEENASGGRIVTAPTNGAAGIIPAVMHYYDRFVPNSDDNGIIDFLLTAAAIGILIKLNASISGAEVGCQGEVGSACSMAAAGLAAVLGGTPEQVENAAEIGIEHNLGLTCDPVGGLVQIPCIERNAIASVKAINAARLSRHGDGSHEVSLDSAIKTMRETGADMKLKYKETSRGGLALNVIPVNVIEC